MMHSMWAITTVVAMLGGGDEELGSATKKASEMTSYAFKTDAKSEGGKGGGKPVTFECLVEKDQPVSIKGGKVEAFKKGEVVIYKEGEEWKKVEAPKKGEKGQDQKGMGALLRLRGLKVPHEELAGFETKFKEAKKADAKENDCTVWSGDLTDEAAKEIAGQQRGKAELAFTGSAKIWINSDGLIVKYEISVKAKGKVKDQDVEITTTRTVEISGVGSTKVEVPEAAKKALEGQP